LSVGDPIDTHGMTPRQVDQLTAQLKSAIEGLLVAAGHSVDRASVPVA